MAPDTDKQGIVVHRERAAVAVGAVSVTVSVTVAVGSTGCRRWPGR